MSRSWPTSTDIFNFSGRLEQIQCSLTHQETTSNGLSGQNPKWIKKKKLKSGLVVSQTTKFRKMPRTLFCSKIVVQNNFPQPLKNAGLLWGSQVLLYASGKSLHKILHFFFLMHSCKINQFCLQFIKYFPVLKQQQKNREGKQLALFQNPL